MYYIGQVIQAGMIIVSGMLTLILCMKFLISGIPRLRVILLCTFFLLSWSGAFIISLAERGPAHSLLWDVFGFFGLAGFLYLFFVALFELLSSPGS